MTFEKQVFRHKCNVLNLVLESTFVLINNWEHPNISAI